MHSTAANDLPLDTPPRPKLYFVNGVVDVALVGGASLLCYALLYVFRDSIDLEMIYSVSAVLLVVVNWPHFSASTYRLYQTRENISQYPVTSLVVPFVVVAGMVAAIAHPHEVAPYLIKLYFIWSPYHFSGQTLGISLIYARRAGLRVSTMDRLALSSFIYSTFLLPTVAFETGSLGANYYGIVYPTFGLPVWTYAVAKYWMWASAAAFAITSFRWWIRDRKPPPPIVFLPALAQFIWFVPGASIVAFRELVPAFHSLQYLLIAWAVQLKERMVAKSIAPSRSYVFWETVRWGLINAIGGLLLFETLPLLCAAAGVDLWFATGVVLATVQIHHFFVDGVIWKLRSLSASSPMLASWPDFVESRPEAVGA